MSTPTLAIQIVNYKSKIFLEPLITQILTDLKGSSLTFEITILDNASGDNLDYLQQSFPDIPLSIYYSTTNLGFGAGHNWLSQKSKSSYLLLLNPDLALIQSGTISRLLASLKEAGATAIGPRLLRPARRTVIPVSHPAHIAMKQQIWDHGAYTFGGFKPHHTRTEAPWVSGAVFLVERTAFEAVNGFDESYFMYFEDVDLCQRLRVRGHVVIYDPAIEVLHYGGASAKRGSKYAKQISTSFVRFHRRRLTKKKP